jgi:glycosyltransferase involved in cell wall biosynthesis
MFREALCLGADIILTLDGDAQHDPRQIPLLIASIDDAEIVIGSRFLEGGNSDAPTWRENGIKMITSLSTRKEIGLTDAQSGFRAYTRKAIESLSLTEDGMGISTEILVKAEDQGFKISEVPINIKYGEDTSTHNPLMHGFEVVLSTLKHLSTRRPLLFYGVPGFLALCMAGFFWAWSLQIFTKTKTISTNVALVALSGTVIGMMFMTTAIILWVLISIIREGA